MAGASAAGAAGTSIGDIRYAGAPEVQPAEGCYRSAPCRDRAAASRRSTDSERVSERLLDDAFVAEDVAVGHHDAFGRRCGPGRVLQEGERAAVDRGCAPARGQGVIHPVAGEPLQTLQVRHRRQRRLEKREDRPDGQDCVGLRVVDNRAEARQAVLEESRFGRIRRDGDRAGVKAPEKRLDEGNAGRIEEKNAPPPSRSSWSIAPMARARRSRAS